MSRYTITVLLTLTALGVVRLITPVDFKVAYVIRSTWLIPGLRAALCAEVFAGRISVGGLLGIIWGAGTAYFGARSISIELKAYMKRKAYTPIESAQVRRLLSELDGEYTAVVSNEVDYPYTANLFRPVIYLPDIELEDAQMRVVLVHEIAHIHAHDGLRKALFLMIEAVFWWNPLAHTSMNEVDTLLELQCDARVCEGADREGMLLYMHTLLEVMRQVCARKLPETASRFVGGSEVMKQRFEVMLCRDARAAKRARVLLNLMFFAAFLASYFVILQPYYAPPESANVRAFDVAEDCSFIAVSDGIYYVYENDALVAVITEAEASETPYCDYPIIGG